MTRQRNMVEKAFLATRRKVKEGRKKKEERIRCKEVIYGDMKKRRKNNRENGMCEGKIYHNRGEISVTKNVKKNKEN